MGEVIAREVVVAAPAEEVWSALTRADRLRAWFGAEITVDARPGGAVRARWPEGGRSVGSVEAAEEPTRLVFRWRRIDGAGFGSRVGGATRVEFVLEPVEAGTRVSVTEEPVELAAVGEGSA